MKISNSEILWEKKKRPKDRKQNEVINIIIFLKQEKKEVFF